MTLKSSGVLTIGVVTALTLFIGACSDGYGDDGYGDTPNPTATKAATARPTSEPATATATASTTTEPAPATPSRTTQPVPATASPTTQPVPATTPTRTAAPSQLTLIASSVRFDLPSLIAQAGPVTIVLDNRDQGIPHNIHVFTGRDAFGANVGSTEIQSGAVEQTLVLGDLAAGSYFYQCDVHPSRMTGTLTVS